MMRPCAASIFLAACILLAAACSFFDPRTPDDPADPTVPWQSPTSPATVVINLVNAMEYSDVTTCMNCCDSTYMFIPDPLDLDDFGGSMEFDDWDYYVELNTLGNIFAAVVGSGYPADSLVSVTMTTVPGYPDPAAPTDSTDIWRDYTIICAGGEWGGWDRPALGRVRFTMIENEYGFWSMSSWEDIRPEYYSPDTNRTWGFVKATYR